MKKIYLLILVLILFALAGCAANVANTGIAYSDISPSDALSLLEQNDEAILLDVRTPAENLESHIPGSILIPYDQLEAIAGEKLPDKEAIIIVYCRTGRRSSVASKILVRLGYVNVRNLGGILDWPYETIQDSEL